MLEMKYKKLLCSYEWISLILNAYLNHSFHKRCQKINKQLYVIIGEICLILLLDIMLTLVALKNTRRSSCGDTHHE